MTIKTWWCISRLFQRRFAVAVIASFLAFSIPLMAQTSTGRIIGTVTDPQGGALAGANVTVTNSGTNIHWSTTTNAAGAYQVLDLPIGSYFVSVELSGFAKVATNPQELTINQSLRIDVRMQVGAVHEMVVVESNSAQVETVNPTVGGTVTGAPIQDLPLNGRDVLDLALTQPGVTPAQPNTLGAAAGVPSGEFEIAGGRDNAVTYLLDGGDNTSVTYGVPVMNPNPDTIAEFRILTNNYTAEFGRSAGGVVTMVTKSGTNRFHGSVFDYLRNDAMDANAYFNKSNLDPTLNNPRPVLKRNQFGGTLGGPVVRDHAFFFFGYQGQRQNSTEVDPQVSVYTPAELNGDFSQSANGEPDPGVAAFLQTHPYFVPVGGNPANAIIDPAKIDPVAQAYIKNNLIPESSSGILTPNGAAYDNRDEYNLKFDYNASDRDRFTLTMAKFHNPVEYPFLSGVAPNVSGFPGRSEFNNYFGAIGYTRLISPTVLNEFHITAQRDSNRLNVPGSTLPGPSDLGPINITPDQTTGPPQILLNISGAQIGFNINGPANYADTTYLFSDTITWTRGRHTWKAGGSLGIVQNNAVFDYAVNGLYNFYGGTTGNDRADFLLGAPDIFEQYPRGLSAVRSHQYGAFAQDEWRVTPRLILTLGLRYEYSTPKSDPENRNYMIVPGRESVRFPNAPLGLLFPGDPGAPPHGVNFPDRKDWAPRFGFAWDPRGDGKTSVRGGAGVFYDVLLAQDNQYQNGTPPFFSAAYLFLGSPLTAPPDSGPYTLMSDPYGAAGVPNPFPSTPPTLDPNYYVDKGFVPFFGPSSVFIDPHLKTPYIYQYNLSVQEQLGNGLIGELGYVGSTSHKLVATYDSDPFILGTLNRPLDQPGVQNENNPYSAMPETFANLVNANYNGLLASMTKNMGDWHSIGNTFFTVSYTWSHNLNDADGFVRNSNAVPAYDHGLLWASGDSDIRQRFVLSGGWELPFARAWSSGPKRLTSGWSLYPIFYAQTGVPMDVLAGLAVDDITPGPSGAGDQNLVRPDWAGGSPHSLDPHQVRTFTVNGVPTEPGHFAFDPTGLSTPACYAEAPGTLSTCPAPTYGTLGRNFFRAPGRVNLDLSLEKRTQLTERVGMTFRAEFFNILNHTEWESPVASTPIGSPQLGQITSTFDPRIGQLALRFTF